MKSLSGGPFLCLGLVRGRVALRGKIFSSAAEKKFSRRKPPSSLSFPHTFFRFCCVILVYTPVYIKPPHEDANFHTGFISNNFKKMSTTTANPPASAAATKGTRWILCFYSHRNNLRVLSVHFYAAKLFFSFSATERRERCGGENERFDRKWTMRIERRTFVTGSGRNRGRKGRSWDGFRERRRFFFLNCGFGQLTGLLPGKEKNLLHLCE